jgi:hypothetical protein
VRVIARRRTKRAAIFDDFSTHVGQQFSSSACHAKYGSAFRSRVSEINRDLETTLTIRNAVSIQEDGTEESVYWSEVR